MTPRGRTGTGSSCSSASTTSATSRSPACCCRRCSPRPGSRVVTVSSNAHRAGEINFDDLNSRDRYRPIAAYAQSKLANLLFTYELQRRLAAAKARPSPSPRTPAARNRTRPGLPAPGAVAAGLIALSSGAGPRPWARCRRCGPPPIPAVLGGEYYGPNGFGETPRLPEGRRIERAVPRRRRRSADCGRCPRN